MRSKARNAAAMVMLLLTAGCVTVPTGPSVLVMPAPGKSFEQFQNDDILCRHWAEGQTPVSPQQAANQDTATGAAVGTLLGAGLGAAIGAASGNPGVGAAIGAGGGLMLGTSQGAQAGQLSGRSAQQRYDMAYQQCMYAKGNQVPGTSGSRSRRVRSVPPPPPDYPAPVMPGYDPPYRVQ